MVKQKKRGRLHIRVPEQLEERVREYVALHGTTMTAVVTKLLQELLDKEEQYVPEAEQI